MKGNVILRQAIAGWIFFVVFGAFLYLLDGKTYSNLYSMFLVKDSIGLVILILAGLPAGYLISQLSWFTFSLWPVNLKFPWAVTEKFKKAKAEGIGEDAQSDHVYFRDADEGMVSFNSRLADFYSLHMDVITAVIAAVISINLRIYQVGINLAKVLKYPGTSRLVMIYAVVLVLLVIALVFNARNCRRDLIDQKRLWNKEKAGDDAKYIHLNPSLVLVPLVLAALMFAFRASVGAEVMLSVLLYLSLSLFSLYKISL